MHRCGLVLLLLLVQVYCLDVTRAADASGWSHYGGDAGGQRYATASQVDLSTVDDLVRAWTFSTGDLSARTAEVMNRANLQATPILVGDRLVLCTAFNEVIALHPGTGQQQWRFDPQLSTEQHYGNGYTCRGVAAWQSTDMTVADACSSRIFTGTTDARLIALDLRTGRPCADFGNDGTVRIDPGMELQWSGEFQITSAPTVVGDIVIVGSSISDNGRVAAPSGVVRAYDVRSGAQLWTWDPIPRDPSDPAVASWGEGWKTAGHANVWAPMSADPTRGLVFLPTSSASPDFFGGLRPGNNEPANSIVALRAATGELVWSFQIVHHDVWDYDVPAQPTLATLELAAGKRDVVIQGTKQGFVFVLDRDTGIPVFPVEERAVPQGGATGEVLSPTQPFPTHTPALVPQTITADDAWGVTAWDRGACRDAISAARNDGLYTPPSEQGTLLFPFTGGGVNWGGVAFDPQQQLLYVNTSRLVHRVTLFPAEQFEQLDDRYPDKEVSPQTGAPFGMIRELLLSPLGLPCNPPPWGTLAAVDLKSGKILWESRLGTIESLAPLGLALRLGTPTFGAPLVTAGGLVFIGSTQDKYLRAFHAKTGEELWQGRLPAPGGATPLTYIYEGRQYIVIAAGGRRDIDVDRGDSFVAFALPRAGEAGPSLWSKTVDRPGGRLLYSSLLISVALVAIVVMWRRQRVRKQRA